MDRGEKLGLIGGIGGAALGATLWLVILGVVIRSTLLIALPLIIGSICVYSAMRLYNIMPERKFSILGLAFIWLVFWNAILCNFYFEKIPQNIGNISTGKNQISLAQINIMFALFFLAGCGLVLRDIIKGKK